MPAYTQTAVNAVGSNGSILVAISDSAGGGDTASYTVHLAVGVDDGNYTYSSGTPAETSQFGNNGAEWKDLTFTTGQAVAVIYNYANTGTAGATYVVVLRNAADNSIISLETGSIPAVSQP